MTATITTIETKVMAVATAVAARWQHRHRQCSNGSTAVAARRQQHGGGGGQLCGGGGSLGEAQLWRQWQRVEKRGSSVAAAAETWQWWQQHGVGEGGGSVALVEAAVISDTDVMVVFNQPWRLSILMWFCSCASP